MELDQKTTVHCRRTESLCNMLCDLVLHIYKDEEYNASKDKDSYNIVSISTARNGEWVDDTEDVYVTDGS